MSRDLTTEFSKTIALCFRDLLQARYYLAALYAIHDSGELKRVPAVSFCALAHEAIVRDFELICARTFDARTKRGLEYILSQSSVVSNLTPSENEDLRHLRLVARKLTHPRDKAIAHTDKLAVVDMKAVYANAPSWDELHNAVECGLRLVSKAWAVAIKPDDLFSECTLPYDGSDAAALLKLANKQSLHWCPPSSNPDWPSQAFAAKQ